MNNFTNIINNTTSPPSPPCRPKAVELTFPEVPARSFEFLEVPLEGAEWGAQVTIVTEPFTRPAGISFRATVSRAGTVRVYCENRAEAGVVVPKGTYRLEVRS